MSALIGIHKTFGARDAGLVRVHARLDFSTLFENLGADDELLWLDSYFPGDVEFTGKIRPALERGARTRLLITDPRWPNAAYEHDASAQEIEAFIRQVSSVRCTLKKHGLKEESCQILAHDELPCMPVCVVTHQGFAVRGYSGFFLDMQRTLLVYLEWQSINDGMLDNLHGYFNQKWERNLVTVQKLSSAPAIAWSVST